MRTEPSAWMEGYERAWGSNDPAAIVGNWLERRDEPDDWTFRWEPVGIAE